MDNLSEYCAHGTKISDEMQTLDDNVSLRVIKFTPKTDKNNPKIVFVAGWVSLIQGWKIVLRELTKDFTVYYIETREKISSKVNGSVEFSVDTIGKDIIQLISKFDVVDNEYLLFGSSLGATVILDCCRFLPKKPKCLILIGPNARFRVPKSGLFIIRIFPPRLYLLLKPVVKWYLKNFQLDVKSDYKQYEKYCNALDAADPYKLKKAVLKLAKYEIWDILPEIEYPALIAGASKDVMHTPENLHKMVAAMKNATYVDLDTNEKTHSKQMVSVFQKYLDNLN